MLFKSSTMLCGNFLMVVLNMVLLYPVFYLVENVGVQSAHLFNRFLRFVYLVHLQNALTVCRRSLVQFAQLIHHGLHSLYTYELDQTHHTFDILYISLLYWLTFISRLLLALIIIRMYTCIPVRDDMDYMDLKKFFVVVRLLS